MSLMDQRFLGHIVDPMDSDQDQTDLNEDLLFETDQMDLLNSFNYRISEPLLKYFLDRIEHTNLDYFTLILNNLSKVYKLNYLKLKKYDILDKNKYIKDIIYTIIFIKIKLINLIEIQKIDKDISREELEKLLIIENAPDLLVECIKYIDSENYKKFINRLFIEVKIPFYE